MLWDLSRGDRLRYVVAFIALALGLLVMFGVPRLIGFAVDVIAGEPLDVSGAGGVFGAIERRLAVAAENHWLAALWVVLLTSVAGGLQFLRGRWAAQASESVARRLRNRLYGHLARLPCSFHDGSETGDVVQRCTSDVETVRAFMASQVVEVARATLMIVLVVPILLSIDVEMTFVSVALYPLIVVFAVVFFRRIRTTFTTMDEAEGAMTAKLQESLTGVRVVRAFSRQEHERDAFAAASAHLRTSNYSLIRTLAVYWGASDFLIFAQVMIVLFWGAGAVQDGNLSVGELFTFLQYQAMVLGPVQQMGRVLADSGKAVVALGRVREILDERVEDVDDVSLDGADVMGSEGASITVRKLTFAFGRDSKPVLDGLDLHAEPGEIVALVGPPGCGKSVLVQLLLRFYDAPRGTLFVGGRDVLDWDRAALRTQVAAVLQEPFLYSRSLRRNLALGAPEASDDEIERAARDSVVHEAITSFDEGYATVIGERGVTLSGGQRQRVALARALLKDAPILVLDDALSAVDTKTEAAIVDALRRRRGKRTTIVIAHRLSSVVHADRIVVLDRGRATQVGAHAELIATNGTYRRLWEIQSSQGPELGETA